MGGYNETLVLVCSHPARDERCGNCGPPAIDALTKSVAHSGYDNVRILPSSHLGGHKYAANVVIYSPTNPDGSHRSDWFGRVEPDECSALLEAYLNPPDALRAARNKWEAQSGGWAFASLPHSLASKWRGTMGMSKEAQMELFLRTHGED